MCLYTVYVTESEWRYVYTCMEHTLRVHIRAELSLFPSFIHANAYVFILSSLDTMSCSSRQAHTWDAAKHNLDCLRVHVPSQTHTSKAHPKQRCRLLHSEIVTGHYKVLRCLFFLREVHICMCGSSTWLTTCSAGSWAYTWHEIHDATDKSWSMQHIRACSAARYVRQRNSSWYSVWEIRSSWFQWWNQ